MTERTFGIFWKEERRQLTTYRPVGYAAGKNHPQVQRPGTHLSLVLPYKLGEQLEITFNTPFHALTDEYLTRTNVSSQNQKSLMDLGCNCAASNLRSETVLGDITLPIPPRVTSLPTLKSISSSQGKSMAKDLFCDVHW